MNVVVDDETLKSDDYKHAMYQLDSALDFIEQGRFRGALTDLHGALNLRRKIFAKQPNHKQIAFTLMLLADVHLHLEEYDKAEKYCTDGLNAQNNANGDYEFMRLTGIMYEIIGEKRRGWNVSEKVYHPRHSPVDFLVGFVLIVCVSYLVFVAYNYLII